MDDNKVWEQFCVSGKVEDYLSYMATKSQSTDAQKGEVNKGANYDPCSCGEGLLPR